MPGTSYALDDLVVIITIIIVLIIINTVVFGFFFYLIFFHLIIVTFFVLIGHVFKFFFVIRTEFSPFLSNKFPHLGELDIWLLLLNNRTHFRRVKHKCSYRSLRSIRVFLLLCFQLRVIIFVARGRFVILHFTFISLLLLLNLFLE